MRTYVFLISISVMIQTFLVTKKVQYSTNEVEMRRNNIVAAGTFEHPSNFTCVC